MWCGGEPIPEPEPPPEELECPLLLGAATEGLAHNGQHEAEHDQASDYTNGNYSQGVSIFIVGSTVAVTALEATTLAVLALPGRVASSSTM